MLLPTELEGRTHLITLIRLLLSDYYYPGSDWNPDPKIRPVVHGKQLSGSQIRISIRITPNFELRLPMIITSLLTKFRQNLTSRFWEILLTNKQTNRQTDTRRWLQYPAFRGIKITSTARINFAKFEVFQNSENFLRGSQFCLTVRKYLWGELQFCPTVPKSLRGELPFRLCRTFCEMNYNFVP